MTDEINIPRIIGKIIASNNIRNVTENDSSIKYKQNKKKQNNKKKIIEHDDDRLFDLEKVNNLKDGDKIISVKI